MLIKETLYNKDNTDKIIIITTLSNDKIKIIIHNSSQVPFKLKIKITWPSYRALQEAQDIFGLDFDFGEFDKYAQEGYSDQEESDDQYEDEYSDGESQAQRRRKNKVQKKTIYDVSLDILWCF